MNVIETDKGSEYIYMTIPEEYKDLYNKLLICLSEYGIELILDCQASCTSKNKNIIDCWNMFQSMVACYNLGETTKARVFKEYIEAQLEIYYKCNEESEETEDILNVTPTILNFENESIKKKLSIESNTNWNIKTMAKWIDIETESGSGNGSSNVSVENYTGRTKRSSNVTVATSNNKKQVQVKVNQAGKNEFININTTSYNIGSNGGTVAISGTSNSSNLKIVPSTSINNVTQTLKVNNNDESSWDGVNNISINGDPGSDQEFNFEITFTIQANQSQEERNHIFKVTNGDSIESSDITITQTSGTITYGKPVITSFTYDDIPANGGSVLPNVKYSQTYGYNGSPTGGGTITTGGTLAFTGSGVNTQTGEISADNLTTTEKVRTIISAVQCVVTLNGQSSLVSSANCYQEANTVTYGNVIINKSKTSHNVSAAGETINIASTFGITAVQEKTYTSGSAATGSIISLEFNETSPVKGFTLNPASPAKIIVSANTTINTRGPYKVKITANGQSSKTATLDLTITQSAAESTLEVSPTTLEFEAAGGTKTITITSNDSWTIS